LTILAFYSANQHFHQLIPTYKRPDGLQSVRNAAAANASAKIQRNPAASANPKETLLQSQGLDYLDWSLSTEVNAHP